MHNVFSLSRSSSSNFVLKHFGPSRPLNAKHPQGVTIPILDTRLLTGAIALFLPQDTTRIKILLGSGAVREPAAQGGSEFHAQHEHSSCTPAQSTGHSKEYVSMTTWIEVHGRIV